MESFEALYLAVFGTAVSALFLLERVTDLQRHAVGAPRRIVSNVSLFLLGSLASSLLIPVGLYAFALHLPPGLVSGSALPAPIQWLLTFLVLDLWRYGEHRLYHRVALLWRLHRVHHSDTEIDVTTTERHHPIDVLASTLVLMALVAALGLPALGLAIYLLTAVVVSLWSHANLVLPERFDRAIRRVVVTPSLHAVHHSAWQAQTDTNYGSVLTVWDRLFGTYSDPASTQVRQFGLAYFCGPRDARLLRVLQQPFLDHLNQPDHRAPVELPEAERIPLPPAWRRALGVGALGLCAVFAVMWPAWRELAAAWRTSEAFQWGWLVLPLAFYFLASRLRAERFAAAPQPDIRGVLPSVAAAGLWWASDLMQINVGRELALVLAIHAVVFSTLGWRLYRDLFPGLALLFFMVPSADGLQPLLRALTLQSIELFLSAAQLPHSTDGFVVMVGARRYIVVDECSGLAYVTTAMFLGYAFGLFLYRSLRKVVGLSLLGGALGVLCNAVRVNAIVWLDWVDGSQMDLAAHGNIQWLAFLALLGVLLSLLTLLKGEAVPGPASAAAVASSVPGGASSGTASVAGLRARWVAPIAAGLSVLVAVSGANAMLDRAAPAALQAGAATPSTPRPAPPASVAGWTRSPEAAIWSAVDGGVAESLTLVYRRGEQAMQVRIVQTLAPNAKLPAPQTLFASQGAWREVRKQHLASCDEGRCGAFLQTTLQPEGQRQRRDVYAAYTVDGLITDSTLALRTAHVWARLNGQDWRQRALSLTFDGEAPPTEEIFRALRGLHAW